MRKLLFPLLAALLLVSCSSVHPLEYQDLAFDAVISGELNGVVFSASLSLSGPSDAAREFILEVHSPETLSGMKAVGKADGSVEVALGRVTECFGSISALPALERLLSLFSLGDPTAIGTVDGAEIGLSEYGRLTRLTYPDASIYLSPEASLPVKAEAFPDDEEGFYIILFFDSFTLRK